MNIVDRVHLVLADQGYESASRRVDVEEVSAFGAGDRKAVANARRRRDPAPGARAPGLVADDELDLSFEDEKGVGVVLVDVRLDGPEARLAPELEDLELVAFVLDAELTARAGKRLALAGA